VPERRGGFPFRNHFANLIKEAMNGEVSRPWKKMFQTLEKEPEKFQGLEDEG